MFAYICIHNNKNTQINMNSTKNAKEKPKIVETSIETLIPDDKNFNKGTEYGSHLMDESVRKFGLGRSILIDKNNRIIAGNKTHEKAGELGFEKVVVVETDGNTLVAVKRRDIDLDSREGRELAMADNATNKANLAWDEDIIAQVSEQFDINPEGWGVHLEWMDDINPEDYGEELSLKSGDKPDFEEWSIKLSGTQADKLRQAIDTILGTYAEECQLKDGNTHEKTNAIMKIVELWEEQRCEDTRAIEP